ncbi:MAG: 30S ribosomal protein S2, partial [Cellulomonadaceae bacterium]|nr:30S ribosomal protein S2 [Cellulomonadaceae bacterium]
NFGTVSKRLQRLKELEEVNFDDTSSSGFTKKELLLQRRELEKLTRTLGGIRNMTKTPSAIWIVDTNKEHLAVDEAHKLGIPVVAILDTNCDPDDVDWPIPGNDDAIRSIGLLTRVVADAAAAGLVERHSGRTQATEDAQPLAEWEQELLAGAQGSADVAAAAADAVAEAPFGEATAADTNAEVETGAIVLDIEAPLTETIGEITDTDPAHHTA